MPEFSLWMPLASAIKTILTASFGTASGASFTIPDAQFYVRKFPWDVGVTHPAVFLVPVPERIQDDTNASDLWGLGVQVSITSASNRDVVAGHDRLHYLRERAIEEFVSHRIASLPHYFVRIESGTIIDQGAFAADYDVTSFVLRCEYRRARRAQSS